MWCGYVAETAVSLYMRDSRSHENTSEIVKEAFSICYELLPFVSDDFKEAYFSFVNAYPRQSLYQIAILNNLANGLLSKEFAYSVSSRSAVKGNDLFTSHILTLFKNIAFFLKHPHWQSFTKTINSVEKQYSLNADLNHFIGIGIADCIIETIENETIIFDIKYSKYNHHYNLDSDYQLGFYKLLYEKMYPEKQVKIGHLNIYVPEKGKYAPIVYADPNLDKEIEIILDRMNNDIEQNAFIKVCGTGAYNSIQKRCSVKTHCSSSTKGY